MGSGKFSMGEAVRFGWDTMKGNIGFFIGLLITATLIENIPSVISQFVAGDFPLIAALLSLSGALLGLVVQMGLIKICIKFCDGIKGQLDDLLSSFHLIINFIIGSILYGLIILGGTILFIVPGMIWGIKYSLFPYFIVDRELGPLEAIKASGQATEGAKWDLFIFGGLLGLINLAGALVFFVGLLATVPASMVAYAYVYRKLAGGGAALTQAPQEGIVSPMYIKLEA